MEPDATEYSGYKRLFGTEEDGAFSQVTESFWTLWHFKTKQI